MIKRNSDVQIDGFSRRRENCAPDCASRSRRPRSGNPCTPARGNACAGAGDPHVAQATLLRSQLENATHSQRFITFARQHR